jgi:hypothetical protein
MFNIHYYFFFILYKYQVNNRFLTFFNKSLLKYNTFFKLFANSIILSF